MKTPAVLFDLGNVLVRLDPARHEARLGALATREVTVASIAALPALDAASRGGLGPADFLAALGDALGSAASRVELEAAWCDLFTPWPQMEALALQLVVNGYSVYLASNTDPIHFGYLRRAIPVLSRLGGWHLSYEAAAMKPEPAFYTKLLERFGLAARDCVFIDDRPENVAAARALGIRGHVCDGDVAAVRRFLCGAGVAIESATDDATDDATEPPASPPSASSTSTL